MPDFSKMMLGKKAARFDKRTLLMENYLGVSLPPPPMILDYTCGVTQFGMMLNDKLGCCTIAGIGHAQQIWNLNCGKPLLSILDSTILTTYENWDGYVNGDPTTDNGGDELSVLNDYRQQGFNGSQLLSYVSCNPKNNVHMRQGVNLFGVVYNGLEMPLTAQNQAIWDVVGDPTDLESPSAPGSWGGHCTVIPKYFFTDSSGIYYLLTWGILQPATEAWIVTYCSEAYPLLGQDWVTSKPVQTSGWDHTLLLNDLQAVAA